MNDDIFFLLFKLGDVQQKKLLRTFYTLNLQISQKHFARSAGKWLRWASAAAKHEMKWCWGTDPKWMNSSTLGCVSVCVSMHICTSVSVRQSPNRSPWSQWWSRSPTHFPCSLTPSSEFHHTLSLLCLFSLSFSPCYVLLSSPFHSLAPVVTTAIIIPLCFQLIFSLASSLEEDNYQMGTQCFNSDFEVNDSLTFAGLFCSRLWNLPKFLSPLPTTRPLPSSLTSVHTSVYSDIALGVFTAISHCRRSWEGTHYALRLGTLCPCSVRC